MAAMTTVLTEFSDSGNSRTYTVSGHSSAKPKLVLQKRKVATSATASAEDTISVVYGTEDANGDLLQSKVNFTITFRRPINGIGSDVTAALTVLRDIVAGDEFGNTVTTQEYLS